MNYWLWALVAVSCTTWIEYVNRAWQMPSFWHILPYTAPAIVLLQTSIFYLWRDAPSLMIAWILFASGAAFLRFGTAALLLGEPIGWRTVLGAVLVVAGGKLVSMGG